MRMTIGDVAALAGVPTATVRYYERRGLIAKAPRTDSGYRQYPEEVVVRLRFIKRAQELGFTLAEIRDLLDLRVEDAAACVVVEAKTREKLEQVRGKIRELQRLEAALERLTVSCRNRTPTAECPMLEALADGADA